MTRNPYETLKTGAREIRVLVVRPSLRKSSTLKCDLIHADLDSLQDAPFHYYEAVSYTWGDMSITRPIKLNGQPFRITPNLDALLRRLRAKRTKGFYWVDAICINQSNIKERSEQVQLMKAIYESAEQVIVWLGSAADDSDIAMDLMDEITDAEDSADEMEFPPKPPDWLHASLENVDHKFKWIAVARLFIRPWWRRVWIRQEVAVASHIMVLCGDRLHNWPTLLNAFELMDRFSNLFYPFIQEVGLYSSGHDDAIFMDTFREHVSNGGTIDEQELFFHGRGCESTDPRDRIFGLVGLANEETRKALVPDYSLSTNQVFTNATMHLIEYRKSLDCLSGCQNPERKGNLPSWVIDFSSDWREQLLRSYEGQEALFQASASSDLDIKFAEEDMLAMNVKGREVGRIKAVGAGYLEEQDSRYEEYARTFLRAELLNLWVNSMENKSSEEGIGKLIQSWFRTLIAGLNDTLGLRASDDYLETCFPYKTRILSMMTIDYGVVDDLAHEYFKGVVTLRSRMLNRHLFITDTGLLGLGPRVIQSGDVVCVLYGAGVPFILRQVEANKYVIVGETYVDSIMDGEAMHEEDKYQERIFTII